MRAPNKSNVVLVADDDPLIRKLISRSLDTLAKIITVEDGALVEDIYMLNRPDMLFLDIHMPNRSGLDLLERIFSLDPSACIVMVSADSSSDNVQVAIKQGAAGFLVKPFERARVLGHFYRCPTIGATQW